MYRHYLGVDLHRRRTYVVLMDKEGQISDQRRLPNDAMSDYVARLPEKTFAVLEATGNWSYMYDVLAEGVEEVVLAHPKRVKAIAAAKIKNDRIDASTLAHLARAKLVPTSYAPPPEIRELRDLVRHRARLVKERTRHKNRVHHILAKYNLHSPYSDLFGKGGRAFLEDVRDQLSETHHLLLDNYLQLVDGLAERLKPIDKLIRQRAKTDPRIALLMTMPGVGLYTASVIVAEIGDVTRFPGPKQLCSFAGLVPSTRSSDAHIRHGRITKEGSPWLRWVMVLAAQKGPTSSPRLADFYNRLMQRSGKKTARVALARKMLTIVFYMLSRNEPYQERQRDD
jgi:transposase